jgi:hypothetical protein
VNDRHDTLFPLPGPNRSRPCGSTPRWRDYPRWAIVGSLCGGASIVTVLLLSICQNSSLAAVVAGAPKTPTILGWTCSFAFGGLAGAFMGTIAGALTIRSAPVGHHRRRDIVTASLTGVLAGVSAAWYLFWICFAMPQDIAAWMLN